MSSLPPLSPEQLWFRGVIMNRIKFGFFLLMKLPMAWLAGLRVKTLEADHAEVLVRYKWINTNPFKSMYFAVLAMAAEMSTGLLCLMYIQGAKPAMSMLVVGLKAEFKKKAVGLNSFRCEDGALIIEAIEKAKQTGEGVMITSTSRGYDEAGDVVAVFEITWSFKARKS